MANRHRRNWLTPFFLSPDLIKHGLLAGGDYSLTNFMEEKKLTEKVKNFLKPRQQKNKPFTELTDEIQFEIETNAVLNFIQKFDFLSLFEQQEQKGLMDLLLPWLAPIASIITLLIVIFK